MENRADCGYIKPFAQRTTRENTSGFGYAGSRKAGYADQSKQYQRTHGIYSLELYKELSLAGYIPYIVFREYYGEAGELFPTDEVLRRANEEGFIMAKHILFVFAR